MSTTRQPTTIACLLRAGGGLSEAAYATDAELTRYAVVNGEYRETELVTVNMAALLRGDTAADVALSPDDYLSVKEVSRWRGAEAVTLRGEVVFPGKYPIRRGETLSSVLQRAGGLTDEAFPQGSVFTCVELREREKVQLETLARRVERGLSVDDYTGESGGLSQRADAKRIYVVRASGAVEADRRARWFQREVGGGIEPGDTVVVPLKVDQPLARWTQITQITQILYNLAIAATAVSRF